MNLFKYLLGFMKAQNTPAEDRNIDLQGLDDDAIKARLRELLESGRKIEAIKAARKAYNLGLKEAKYMVEQL